MKRQLYGQKQAANEDIERTAETMTKVSNETALKRLEARLASLEDTVQSVSDRLARIESEMPEVRTAVTKVNGFMKSPLETWKKGNEQQRQAVQALVFAEPPSFSKETGVGTAKLSTPFRVLQESKGDKETLVAQALSYRVNNL